VEKYEDTHGPPTMVPLARADLDVLQYADSFLSGPWRHLGRDIDDGFDDVAQGRGQPSTGAHRRAWSGSHGGDDSDGDGDGRGGGDGDGDGSDDDDGPAVATAST
jgi:hypothetical protein